MTTFTEFRHWLEGFSESIGDAPTPAQWARIKEKLALVDQPVVTRGSSDIDWARIAGMLKPYAGFLPPDPDRTEIVNCPGQVTPGSADAVPPSK